MGYAALQVVYHSPICPAPLKKELWREMRSRNLIKEEEEPAQPHYYPPLRQMNLYRFCQALQNEPYADRLCLPSPPAVEVAAEADNSIETLAAEPSGLNSLMPSIADLTGSVQNVLSSPVAVGENQDSLLKINKPPRFVVASENLGS